MKIIDRASHEIVIVSPFLEEIDIVNQLVFKKKVKRKIITRPPKWGLKKFFRKLESSGIELVYPKDDFHLKLQIFDNQIAVVTSYNLTKYSASKNIESGIITINQKVISDIKKSIKQLEPK